MYISRRRKNTYTPVAANKSETEAAPPAELSAPPQEEQGNVPMPLPEEEGPAIQPDQPPMPDLPEAQVELINGDGSDLGNPPPTAGLTYEEFLAASPSTGFLKVQAFIGQQGMPVSGAFITVSAPFKDGERIFYALKTDADGIVDGIVLPTPSRESSAIPGSDNPFAVYTVTASHPMYRTAVYGEVPVFSGVKSIQPVVFFPKGEER